MLARAPSPRPGKVLALKPQDVVIAARLALGDAWTYERLARELGMSSQTVHASVKRLVAARLYNPIRNRVAREDLLEFIIHGVRFAFPAETGAAMVQGVPTGASAPPLTARFASESSPRWVWPSPGGPALGRSITPLHPSVPKVAAQNPTFHELLSLIDALRVGGARDREVASEELRRRLPP